MKEYSSSAKSLMPFISVKKYIYLYISLLLKFPICCKINLHSFSKGYIQLTQQPTAY